MKYVATGSSTAVPNSSTSYYKSQRCRFGCLSAPTHMTMASGDVIIKPAESSTSDPQEPSTDCKRSLHTKPTQSYVMMIATAILQTPDQRMSLGSIYNWIEKQYPYFTESDATQGRWRNSVRHNLSLNDCFIKVGRCEDGKGNYWSIHPQNIADFKRGDFKQKQSRRRRGRRKDATDTYLSLLTTSGEVFMDPKTGLPLYSPYTDEERKAYRLDEALVKRSIRGFRFVPPTAENYASPPHTSSQYVQWQYPSQTQNQSDPSYCYPSPYSPPIPAGHNTTSNSAVPNVNYHHYYHHSPRPPITCNRNAALPCQCCPHPPMQQFHPPTHRY